MNYLYEVEIVPSTSASMSDDILPKLEIMFINALIPSLFEECRPQGRRSNVANANSIKNLKPMRGVSSYPPDVMIVGTFELRHFFQLL